MILMRFENGKPVEKISYGTREELTKESYRLGLKKYHNAFFYEEGKFINLGLYDSDYRDYYMIVDNDY